MAAVKIEKARPARGNNYASARWVRGWNSSAAPDSDKALAIFQPDILIREQFLATFERRHELLPEKVLILAILQDAVICIRDNLGATERKKRQLLVDTLDWLTARDSSYLYSFENICDALGFAPSYMRRGFMKLKEELLAARSPRRLAS